MKPSDEEKAFWKGISEHYDDPTYRLVFADWLEEKGRLEEAIRQRDTAEDLKYRYIHRCSWCGKLSTSMVGNHHPYCACGSDEFDWSTTKKMLKEDAEKYIEGENR